jgi:hypothetical protein
MILVNFFTAGYTGGQWLLYYGQSVSISGDYAIVGAYQEDTKGSNSLIIGVSAKWSKIQLGSQICKPGLINNLKVD